VASGPSHCNSGLRLMLRALVRSESLRAAAAMGVGGASFALGSLVLAKVLSPGEYGLVSLFIGIVAVCGFTGPLGLDLVVARRGLQLDSSWRRAALAACTAVGVVAAVVTAIAYHLALPLSICVLCATAARGVVQACGAHFRGERRFAIALWILQLSNGALVPVALCSALFKFRTAIGPSALITVAGVAGASAAWLQVVRSQRPGEPQPPPRRLLGEALSLVTLESSSAVFLQLERLLLVPTAGIGGLALFGVLAALVGSPFRLLQQAAQFTLVPSLRAASGTGERVQLLRREAVLVSLVSAAGSIVIWFAAPWIARGFLGGRYDLRPALVMAGLVSGLLKVFSAFAFATAIALARDRSLRILGALSWASLGVSVAGAFAAMPWGLVGVLYGVSLGWLIRAVAATWLALPYLRRAAPARVPTCPNT